MCYDFGTAETAAVRADGIRTDDLFNAIEALSQLSYGPIFHVAPAPSIGAKRQVVRAGGGIIANQFAGTGWWGMQELN